MTTETKEVFYTDKQLQERWHCSHMKLWRMRQQGKLRSFKAGGTGPNLTPHSEVKANEEGAEARTAQNGEAA
jgi:hypothetical protein